MFKTIHRLTSFYTCCNKSAKIVNPVKLLNRSYSYLDQFDPPYLDSLKPEIPEYDAVNVQIKGYDFAVLENYQSFVHRIARSMDIDVEEGWSTPATITQIKKYKPNSTNVESEYKLPTYERNIQVTDVSSAKMAIFAEVVQASLPQGVSVSIHEHQQEHDDIRFVPDYELNELKAQLETYSNKKK